MHLPIEPSVIIDKTKEPREFKGKKAYDPFSHGTNCAIFCDLPKTDFQIMSPLQMITQFRTTSRTGELVEGGYERIPNTLIEEERNKGRTSFARLSQEFWYGLDTILRKYTTSLPVPSREDSLTDFKKEMQKKIEFNFFNTDLFLIYFTRARQAHDSLEQVITAEELNIVRKRLGATLEFYCFIQLFGTHIFPDYHATKRNKEAISEAGYLCLSAKSIIDKIIENNLDVAEVLKNPSPQNLETLISILEFPEELPTKFHSRGIQFKDRQLFCLAEKYQQYMAENPRLNIRTDSSANKMAFGSSHEYPYTFAYILECFLLKKAKPEFFKKLAEDAQACIRSLKQRIQAFEDLVATPQSHFKMTPIQQYFLQHKIPLVILCEAEDKMFVFDNVYGEYRCRVPLKFGQDINAMATDTEENRLKVLKYWELNKIHNIQVFLFSDLKQMKISKIRINTLHHDENSIPTLKWLSAKKVSEADCTFFQSRKSSKLKSPASACVPSLYSEKNLQEVDGILEEAQKFNRLSF